MTGRADVVPQALLSDGSRQLTSRAEMAILAAARGVGNERSPPDSINTEPEQSTPWGADQNRKTDADQAVFDTQPRLIS